MAGKDMGKANRKHASDGVKSILLICALFLMTVAFVLLLQVQRRYDLQVGSTSGVTITAPEAVIDQSASETQRAAARNRTESVYVLDDAEVNGLLEGAEGCFNTISAIREEAQALRDASIIQTADGELAIDNRSWQVVIPQADLMEMLSVLPFSIEEPATGYALLSATEQDLTTLHDTVMASLTEVLNAGVSEDTVTSVQESCIKSLQKGSLSSYMKAVGALLFRTYIQPTYYEDADLTALAKEAAAEAVDPVMLEKGSVIVEKGDVITQAQYETLVGLGLIKGQGSDAGYDAGLILYVVILFFLFTLYLIIRQKEIFRSFHDMVLLSSLLAATLMLNGLSSLVDVRITFSVATVTLVAMLLSRRTAEGVNVFLTLLYAITAGGRGNSVLSQEAFICEISALCAGESAVLLLSSSRARRLSAIFAGLLGALTSGLTSLSAGLLLRDGLQDILVRMGIMTAPCLIGAVIVCVVETLLENMFDIATPMRLEQICSESNPLLRRLRRDAPGTFSHSKSVSRIAAAAAKQIGASHELARAGGLYHDVGKLRRPQYFSENQDGENIHDGMDPYDSANVIIAHAEDAKALLEKAGIPSDVIKIALCHHGTYPVGYFYRKALKAYDKAVSAGRRAEPVLEEDFRYPGPLPDTREGAIVMMADCAEAAARQIQPETGQAVRELVDSLVDARLADGQFDRAPLTMPEIAAVKDSIANSLQQIYVTQE